MATYLGIDLSTQSISACVYNGREIVQMISVSYAEMPEIDSSLMDKQHLIIPKRIGQAEQDPMIFLCAVDRLLENLKKSVDLSEIQAIQFSAQQHGHVYLNQNFSEILQNIKPESNLWENLKEVFSYEGAPIWRTADTIQEAEDLRNTVGGKQQMIRLTGSDSPLRFTGAIIKKLFDHVENLEKDTNQIMLLNTFLSSIFSNNPNPDVDWGNAAGTSLMDYNKKEWSNLLFHSTHVQQKFGQLNHPLTLAGTIHSYFVKKYRFSEKCLIGIGTGDNPATKVLCQGDLLSLGTSFVYMKSTNIEDRDLTGVSNAMYDGVGNPFMILCRTNGALIWDRIRLKYQKDFSDAHQALLEQRNNQPVMFWQIEQESVPLSRSIGLTDSGSFAEMYKGLVLSNLGLLALYTDTIGSKTEILAVTGGSVYDSEIVQIIADLWQCPVQILPAAGAALGAALMAAQMMGLKIEQDLLGTTIVYPKQDLNTYKEKLRILVEPYLIK
ncbi:MAG: FGGY family carbohydrate kinase [Brevinema sp.]